MNQDAWTLDGRLHLLRRGPACLHLTPIEWRLLHALLEARGRPCSGANLLEGANTDGTGGTGGPSGPSGPSGLIGIHERTVDIHVRSLRCKIAAIAPLGANIETLREGGYRLDRSIDDDGEPDATPAPWHRPMGDATRDLRPR